MQKDSADRMWPDEKYIDNQIEIRYLGSNDERLSDAAGILKENNNEWIDPIKAAYHFNDQISSIW